MNEPTDAASDASERAAHDDLLACQGARCWCQETMARAAEHLIAPVCATCGREVDKIDGSWWHVLDRAPDDLSALDGPRG